MKLPDTTVKLDSEILHNVNNTAVHVAAEQHTQHTWLIVHAQPDFPVLLATFL